MSDELPPVRCDDESTWRHKGEKIDLPRLLTAIEAMLGISLFALFVFTLGNRMRRS